jgi:hypothetical protein
MSIRILRGLALGAVVASTLSVSPAKTWASSSEAGVEESTPSAEINIQDEINQTDEADLRDAQLIQADRLRSVPSELWAEGIQVTAEQEARFNQLADQTATDANKPGLKQRMSAAFRVAGHGSKRAGILTLEAIGYGGSAVAAAGLAPFAFGVDFTSSLFTGKGVITSNQSGSASLAGMIGGAGIWIYTYDVLAVAGLAAEGTILASSLGVVLVNEIVCSQSQQGPELKTYCTRNDQLFRGIGHGAAHGGKIAGSTVHKGIVIAAKWVAYPFRHHRK